MMMFSNSFVDVEPALCLDIELQLLVIKYRACADTTDGGLDVLRLDRLDDVAGGQIETGQPIRPDPGAHGIIQWRKQERIADAWRALDRIEQIDGDVVRQK